MFSVDFGADALKSIFGD